MRKEDAEGPSWQMNWRSQSVTSIFEIFFGKLEGKVLREALPVASECLIERFCRVLTQESPRTYAREPLEAEVEECDAV